MKKIGLSEKIISMSKFDLNLLTVFYLIYTTSSISKTADILTISPSAVSQSLKKLRAEFNDILFVRTGNTLQPTVYADELYYNVFDIMTRLSGLLPDSLGFVLKKNLTIITESVLSPLIVPQLTQLILNKKLDINVLHLTFCGNQQNIVEMLNLRQVDIAFSYQNIQADGIDSVKLFGLKLNVVASINNSLYSDVISDDEFEKAELVGYNTINEKIIYYRKQIDRKYRKKERRLLTSSLVALMNVIAHSDCIGAIPEKIYESYAKVYGLRKIQPPFPLPEINVYMTYRKEHDMSGIVSRILLALKEHYL